MAVEVTAVVTDVETQQMVAAMDGSPSVLTVRVTAKCQRHSVTVTWESLPRDAPTVGSWVRVAVALMDAS